jgi:hypothetical protein
MKNPRGIPGSSRGARELALLHIANAYEQATEWHKRTPKWCDLPWPACSQSYQDLSLPT